MDQFVGDQAAGLRRLLGQTGFQVITVMSGQQGAGKTAATANLAVALARSGRDVLIIDQDQHGRGASSALGLTPRYDMADVLAGRCTLDALILTGPDNVQVLPIGGGFNRLGRLSERDQEWLAQSFNRLQCGVDVVLVDMEEATDPDALPLGLAASEIMVVLPPGSTAIGKGTASTSGMPDRRAVIASCVTSSQFGAARTAPSDCWALTAVVPRVPPTPITSPRFRRADG